MEKTLKVGAMPGRIEEFCVEIGTPITKVLEMADLNAAGYDVKIDGTKITDLSDTVVGGNTNLILLAKQVKGN